MFMKRSIYKPACYDCMYVGNRRVGDITLGDFWGLDNDIERKTNIQGINLLFVNNDAGQGLIKTIEDDIEIYSRPIHEAINGNDTLREATHKPKEYDDLWLNIKKDGFHKAVKKVYGIDWRKSAINWRFKLVKSKIKKILYYH